MFYVIRTDTRTPWSNRATGPLQTAQILRQRAKLETDEVVWVTTIPESQEKIIFCLPIDRPRAERIKCVEVFLRQQGVSPTN